MKEITPDGNCFYRCLSYFYRQKENDYNEFRQLITNYIEQNIDYYLIFISDEEVNIKNEDGLSDDEIIKKKKDYLLQYIENAKKDKYWAGDLEISTANLIFNAKILIYTLENDKFNIYNEFSNESNSNKIKDIIQILFINNNHFNLLIKQEYADIFKVSDNIQKLEFTEFAKLITIKKIDNKDLIKNINIKNIRNEKYVSFNRKTCENYYNEIADYILDNNNIPARLKNNPLKKNKRQSKKRGKFRKMIKNHYRLYENRLQYKKFVNNEEKWLYIPFENEVQPLLNYVHFNNHHLKKDRMCIHIIKLGFFWFGYTESIVNFIKKCGKCHCEEKSTKISSIPKIIITNGPHIRYQADIWYLPKQLKTNNNYNYCLDIIDHFSKWSYSYLLQNKDSEIVVSKIKSFININGKCKIFQSDNGLEFNNSILKLYLENEKIKYIRSAPYHPQTNGCVEALHKQIKKYLLDEYEKKLDKFNIDVSLIDAINYHNSTVHTITKYEPNFLRNITNESLIEEVVNNIVNCMKRKIKKNKILPKNTLLLLNEEIELKGNFYVLKKNKPANKFTIPALLIKYINNNNISIKVLVNNNNSQILRKGNILNVNIETSKVIDEYGFQYYLKQFGENVEEDTINFD